MRSGRVVATVATASAVALLAVGCGSSSSKTTAAAGGSTAPTSAGASSGGGGAEMVSEEEARAAIRRGEEIVIDEAGSLQNLGDLRVERTPADKAAWYPIVLAYRQAGMFVTDLRESDRPAFDRMMNAILDGRTFAQAVTIGYHDNAPSLWQKFSASATGRTMLRPSTAFQLGDAGRLWRPAAARVSPFSSRL